MKAYIRTYGCTLNQADSDIMRSILKSNNIELVDNEKEADAVVVNTCTVKNATSQKILYKLNNLENDGKKLIVTGCMASANKDLIEKYAPNASIVTIPNMERIASAFLDTVENKKVVLDAYAKKDRILFLDPAKDAIARVPVNDGCTSSCSFCETKFARGALNSFSEELILKAIENSIRNGAKEIQLTSQDMGAYRLDKNTNIAELMQKISAMDGNFKVRVGMLNPEHLHRYFDEFADALKSDKFYKFVHIPVQSGSNKVLKDMRRMYTIEQFDSYVKKLRDNIPDITIETDMIVGFPTETENDFEKSVEFIKRTKPEVTNISRFGARPHASASQMTQIPRGTIKQRSMMLSRVVRSIQHEINDRFIGKRFDVIITESNRKSINGRNPNYKQVVIVNSQNMRIGSTHKVLINSASANVLYA